MLSDVQWTPHRLVARADKFCAAVHLLVWFVVAVVWAVNWRLNGPSPSGPLFNSAYRFIGRTDYFVKATIDDLTMKIGLTAAGWFSFDLGATFTVVFACLILLGGTLQWFLLGKLAQWTAARKGITTAMTVLALYAVWIGGSVFIWIAA